MPRTVAAIAVLIGAFIIFFSSSSSYYTIDATERGVILRNGAIIGEAEPGLHFKLPFIDKVASIDFRSTFWRKTMETYSRDQQPANLTVSVMYHVANDGARTVYSRYGSLNAMAERAIEPKMLEQTKNIFGQYDAVTAVQDRTRLNGAISDAITKSVRELDVPVIVEGVQVENIEFSGEYMKSIEQRMQASVEVDRLKQNALREQVQAEITVTQANAKADAVRAEAKADADSVRLRGEAEAEAISARAKALGENPGLVALTEAEKWDGRLPTTMVPGGAVPLLRLGASQ